jgi:hypothetical protein
MYDNKLEAAAAYRLDVELEMCYCILLDGASGAFVECLQSDRGPVKLIDCPIDNQILASALTGKSRVTKLTPDNWTNDADVAILFRALANNSGLMDLHMFDKTISDDNWSILCESLQAHPTLSSLDLRDTGRRNEWTADG